MKAANPSSEDQLFVRRAVEAAIRIGVLALLVLWSLLIVKPFIAPVLWGVILAVAVFPAYGFLVSKLGGRRKLTATLLTIVALAALLIPAVDFFGAAFGGIRSVGTRLEEGTLRVPPPPESVSNWPLIGEDVQSIWSEASVNLDATLERFQPQVRAFGRWLLSAAAGLGMTVVQFIISIIIAGVFLATAGSGKDAAVRVATRFAGHKGAEFATMAEKTIRSVALGVLGIATIQSILGGLGMALAGVPAAGLWALAILILAVIQLPPLLVMGPAAVYVFANASTVVAVLFLIWAIVVSGSDTFLKPLLLGRGVNVPMLVILLGAIGGMMMMGIIGLFLGAVILAIGYQLFVAWLEDVSMAGGEPAVAEGGDV
ncbi:MAG: AI-2E family transporter [Gemmatimonadales bacterium]